MVNGMELDYNAIGVRIKQERLRQKISQEQLAERTPLSVTHMSHIETGNTKVSLPTLLRIANALNVTVDMLLCDSLSSAKPLFENEIMQETADCSEEEIRIIADMAKSLKNSLRRRRNAPNK